MSELIIAVIAVLSVIFIIILLDSLLRKSVSYICTEVGADEECVEAKLRTLIQKNPNSEIIVINSVADSENKKILEKLSEDFTEIHILNI